MFVWTCLAAFLLVPGFIRAQDTARGDGYRRFYYPGGTLSGEGMIRDGKPDGYWKAYYENGRIKSEGNRRNFELDSVWTFYDTEGKKTLEINYRNGKKHGYRISWLDRETVKENFREDVREGLTLYCYPDGKVRQTVPFVKGLEQGFGREYAPDGTVVTLTEYKKGYIVDRLRINRRDASGLKQGRWFTFWENGNPRTEISYRDDRKNGYFKEYAENGDLLKITKYTNDQPEPEAEEIRKLDVVNEYYPDGKVKISAMYRNGVPEGIRREYGPDGSVVSSTTYRNGQVSAEGIVRDDGNRDGPWKEFYPDGTLRAEGTYTEGKQTGEWKYYHPDGKIEQAGRFNRQGKPDGTWKWYYPAGSLLREESYRNGLRDGLSTEYDENGIPVTEGEYVNGKEDGPWFERIGDTFVRGAYRDGLRTGPWIYYYLEPAEGKTDSLCFYRGGYLEDNPDGRHTWYWENGKVREEGSFLNGRKEGEWYRYNSDGTLFMTITYKQGAEIRFDGVRIKPPFEKEED